MTIETQNFKDMEAIGYLTSVSLAAANDFSDVRIIEHNAGIDVDNAARPYDHESDTTYEHVMWCALNYMSDGYGPIGRPLRAGERQPENMSGYFNADVETGVRQGNADSRMRWFHIETGWLDGESRGLHFEFRWATTLNLQGFEMQSGDQFDVSAPTEGEYVWATISDRRYHGDDSVIIFFEDEDGNEIHQPRILSDEGPTYKVRRFV